MSEVWSIFPIELKMNKELIRTIIKNIWISPLISLPLAYTFTSKFILSMIKQGNSSSQLLFLIIRGLE